MAVIRTCQAFVSQSEKRNTQDFAASIADQTRSRPTTSYRSTTVLYAVFPLNCYIIYRGLCIVSINGSLPDERSIRVNFIKRNATASAVRYVSVHLLGHPSTYACTASFKATPSPRWTGGTATPNTPRPRRNEKQRKFTGHLVFHSLSVLSSSPSNSVRVGRCVPIMDSVTLPTKLRSICCVTFRPPPLHAARHPSTHTFVHPALHSWPQPSTPGTWRHTGTRPIHRLSHAERRNHNDYRDRRGKKRRKKERRERRRKGVYMPARFDRM